MSDKLIKVSFGDIVTVQKHELECYRCDDAVGQDENTVNVMTVSSQQGTQQILLCQQCASTIIETLSSKKKLDEYRNKKGIWLVH